MELDRKIAIVGQAQINSEGVDKPRERILFELVKGLFDDLGIDRHQIDTFVVCSNDFYTGRTISNVFEDSPIGAYMKDETKSEVDGVLAASYAFVRLLSGHYDTALVVSNSLGASEFRPYLAMDYQLNPTYDRQLGLINELSSGALQAHSYMERFGMTEDQVNERAAQLLACAAKNPDSIRSDGGVTAGDVAASEYLYEPLRSLHCYPFTDGFCALVLASGDRARDLTDTPVWIRGVGDSVDTYYIGERDLSVSESTRKAAGRAYGMAGITDAASEIDVAEVSAKFVPQEPVICEGLGLFEEGSGGKVADEGLAVVDGDMPVCPSGGLLGANALAVAGLVRLAECYKQLSGTAGATQVAGAETAVAHGQDGFCAQHNAVVVLSREEG
jgi:acetyl-CoA C-acetyltransferase